jgi:hypothetical protein
MSVAIPEERKSYRFEQERQFHGINRRTEKLVLPGLLRMN